MRDDIKLRRFATAAFLILLAIAAIIMALRADQDVAKAVIENTGLVAIAILFIEVVLGPLVRKAIESLSELRETEERPADDAK